MPTPFLSDPKLHQTLKTREFREGAGSHLAPRATTLDLKTTSDHAGQRLLGQNLEHPGMPGKSLSARRALSCYDWPWRFQVSVKPRGSNMQAWGTGRPRVSDLRHLILVTKIVQFKPQQAILLEPYDRTTLSLCSALTLKVLGVSCYPLPQAAENLVSG